MADNASDSIHIERYARQQPYHRTRQAQHQSHNIQDQCRFGLGSLMLCIDKYGNTANESINEQIRYMRYLSSLEMNIGQSYKADKHKRHILE
jgi:hypothetical protein